MKRALLIAGGTVGGLGAVLSITPPQLGSNALSTIAGASAATSLPGTTATATTPTKSAAVTSSATPTAKAVATKKATTQKSTTTSSSSSSNSSSNSSSTTNNSTATQSAAPAATPTKAAASSVSGSFTGDVINVGYGPVQVKITVSNGKITEATAVQAPSGRSQRFTDYSVPNLRQQTLSAQSAAISGIWRFIYIIWLVQIIDYCSAKSGHVYRRLIHSSDEPRQTRNCSVGH